MGFIRILILILRNGELSMQWTTVKIAVAKLRTSISALQKNSGSGIVECQTSGNALRKNSGSGIADQHWQTTKFLKVDADYGKNSGCPPMRLEHVVGSADIPL
jgi:hypothetical protein